MQNKKLVKNVNVNNRNAKSQGKDVKKNIKSK